MADMATPNLPSRDLDRTEAFYAALGFTRNWRDDGWMILERGGLRLEFFPHPQVDPLTSWFSACLRLDDLDAFYHACLAAGIREGRTGEPRLHPPRKEPWGGTVANLVDPDGTLLHLVQN